MLSVVAALIEFHGKVLVCQRRRNDTFGLMWEFPGGKRRKYETHEEALERELLEELGVESRIGPAIYRTRHAYAEMREPIELTFFRVMLDPMKIQNLAFETMEWHEPEHLPGLNFLPADIELVSQLAAGRLNCARAAWASPPEPPRMPPRRS